MVINSRPAVLAASGPLIGLWSYLSRQGFSGKSEELMPLKAVIEVCQQTLALIGMHLVT